MEGCLSATSVYRLEQCNAPVGLLELVDYTFKLHSPAIQRDLDLVEVFAGEGELSRQFAAVGLAAETYDIVNDSMTQDFTTVPGFLHALFLARALAL